MNMKASLASTRRGHVAAQNLVHGVHLPTGRKQKTHPVAHLRQMLLQEKGRFGVEAYTFSTLDEY
jgi:hypothetical protein